MKTVLLGELFQIGSSKRVLKSQWTTEGVPFYRGREITRLSADGYVDNELYISEDLYSDYKKKYGTPMAGDIMITAIGTIGNTYIVQRDDKFYFKDASVLWLHKKADANSEFIDLWLKSPRFKEQLNEGNGATVDTLTIKKLQSVTINLPSSSQQEMIVGKLDEAFAAIDKAKENTEKNLSNTKELFESYLQSVFSNHGEDWKDDKLGDVLQKTETINPVNKPDEEFVYVDVSSVNKESLLIVKTSLIKGRDAPSRARKLVRSGDIIFATVRPTLKRIAAIPESLDKQVCSTGYFVMRAKEQLDNRLIFYFVQTENFNKRMARLQKGASYPAVTDSQIGDQIISYPKSLSEQRSIIAKLDTLFAETKKLESIYKQKITDLEELKKSVLQKAFAGEL